MIPSRLSNETTSERSPLVSPSRQPGDNDVEDRQPLNGALDWDDDDEATTKSKSSWYLFLLTLSIGGLQIVWSVELSNGSPYLLSLGMTKSLLAMVWIAGPLSGALVQPYVGIRSDNCRISWGKRKPFMIGGGAATIVSLLLLAWIREIVGGFLALFGVAAGSPGAKSAIIFFATVAMYVLDFSINTVQAGIRAFIVDNAPAHQQESANAWASRITGVGNVLGYVFGYTDLPSRFPFFGNTQFKVLCVIASLSLGTTLLISCLYIQERDPRLEGPPANDNPGVWAFFKQVFKSVKRLPPQIRKVCEVQFFAWIGWFPFLFYITTYIGQLYVNPFLVPELSDDELHKLWEQATRVGTFALLIYAIISLLANLFLPFLVEPTYVPKQPLDSSETIRPSLSPSLSFRSRRSSLGALPFSASTANLGSYPPTSPDFSQRSKSSPVLSRQLAKLRIPNLTLRRTWILSQLFFAICMFTTFFISTPIAATIMTAFVGISWSVTLWIPFALISAEVAQQDEVRREKLRQTRQEIGRRVRAETSSARSDHIGLDDSPTSKLRRHHHHHHNHPLLASQNPDHDLNPISSTTITTSSSSSSSTTQPPTPQEVVITTPQQETSGGEEEEKEEEEEPPDQAGMILGLHNVAISTPQILATLISSLVFHALQKERGVPGDASVGWVLRIGGVAALVASWWARGLAEGEGGGMGGG